MSKLTCAPHLRRTSDSVGPRLVMLPDFLPRATKMPTPVAGRYVGRGLAPFGPGLPEQKATRMVVGCHARPDGVRRRPGRASSPSGSWEGVGRELARVEFGEGRTEARRVTQHGRRAMLGKMLPRKVVIQEGGPSPNGRNLARVKIDG